MIHVDFAAGDCGRCPSRSRGAKAKVGLRSPRLQSREEHEVLCEARKGQKSDEFAAEYARRAYTERTIWQEVCAFGPRVARYRRLSKTRLQHTVTVAAINIERLDDWLIGQRPIKTKPSRFAALAYAS